MASEQPPMNSKETGQGKCKLVPRSASVRRRPRYKPKVIIEYSDVSDPDNPRRRIQVSRNLRVDILAREYSQGRISRHARSMGRILQSIFERGHRTRALQAQWQPQVDRTASYDLAIIRSLDDAAVIQAYQACMNQHVGPERAAFLRKILTEDWTYSAIAKECGLPRTVDARVVAKRFRSDLEELADAWRASRPAVPRSRPESA